MRSLIVIGCLMIVTALSWAVYGFLHQAEVSAHSTTEAFCKGLKTGDLQKLITDHIIEPYVARQIAGQDGLLREPYAAYARNHALPVRWCEVSRVDTRILSSDWDAQVEVLWSGGRGNQRSSLRLHGFGNRVVQCERGPDYVW